jgi:hypothetical protein
MDAAIQSLKVMGTSPPFPASFLPNGFVGLRHLSMVLKPVNPGDVCEFSTVLTGLESLEVLFETAICRDLFLTRLPPMHMPRLTELQMCALEVRPGSSARFLAGLPQLRSLKLVGVLDVRHWDDDVKHIAALRELKQLTLQKSDQLDQEARTLASAQVKPLIALKQLQGLSVSPPPLGRGCGSPGLPGGPAGSAAYYGSPTD